jgi:hypothetical protein
MDYPRVITSANFHKALVAAGVVREDESLYRVVIDAKAGDIVRMYIERNGDERLLDVVPTLDGIRILTSDAEEGIDVHNVKMQDAPS